MSNATSRKVIIQIESAEEQQENIKNTRKTFKVLQSGATDKENLAGRPIVDKLSRIKAATDPVLISTELAKRKKLDLRSSQTQTTPKKLSSEASTSSSVTVEDLTSTEEPGEHYWKLLAEKRREALEKALEENRSLNEKNESLQEELAVSRQMLEETRNLVEVLTEMLNENEAEKEIGNETEDTAIEKVSKDPDNDDDNQSVTEPEQDEDSHST